MGASGGSDHPTTTRDDSTLPQDTNPDTETRLGGESYKGKEDGNSSEDTQGG